jgi:hypothetical protein
VLLVVEVVSPGSETTDRIVKADQYAEAGIAFTGGLSRPSLAFRWCTRMSFDPATGAYRDVDVFTGVVKVSAPFPIEIDLGQI